MPLPDINLYADSNTILIEVGRRANYVLNAYNAGGTQLTLLKEEFAAQDSACGGAEESVHDIVTQDIKDLIKKAFEGYQLPESEGAKQAEIKQLARELYLIQVQDIAGLYNTVTIDANEVMKTQRAKDEHISIAQMGMRLAQERTQLNNANEMIDTVLQGLIAILPDGNTFYHQMSIECIDQSNAFCAPKPSMKTAVILDQILTEQGQTAFFADLYEVESSNTWNFLYDVPKPSDTIVFYRRMLTEINTPPNNNNNNNDRNNNDTRSNNSSANSSPNSCSIM